ncbi:hypothetical protein ANRL1_04571 [Anaerolineae bacterium]|nr:hypothetical protein ANRL1_04571 [Anaerolineae bacterium]
MSILNRLVNGVQYVVAIEPDPQDYDQIYLADNEWGSDLMYQVAREYFDSNPTRQFVLVYEHAGWWLGMRNDATLSCWTTANDMAILPKRFPRPNGFSGISIRRQQGVAN